MVTSAECLTCPGAGYVPDKRSIWDMTNQITLLNGTGSHQEPVDLGAHSAGEGTFFFFVLLFHYVFIHRFHPTTTELVVPKKI